MTAGKMLLWLRARGHMLVAQVPVAQVPVAQVPVAQVPVAQGVSSGVGPR